ncbi:Secreted protein OS=Stutzerimonas stutzeri OX=316 GN=CXK95_14490 PE=4 SV=1 [Stutzerimonas stutzeri]
MNPTLRLTLALLAAVVSLPAAAQSCYVHSETSGAVPAPVVTKKCFELRGMQPEDDSMDWLCRNEEGVKSARREPRQSCPDGHFGVCVAAVTPETLANEQAGGSQATNGTLPTTVPEGAQIVTYHYHASDRAQAKVDCESAGGQWSR